MIPTVLKKWGTDPRVALAVEIASGTNETVSYFHKENEEGNTGEIEAMGIRLRNQVSEACVYVSRHISAVVFANFLTTTTSIGKNSAWIKCDLNARTRK